MCNVCHSGFGMLRMRKWCQGCGHAICRNCTTKVALLKDGVLLGPCIPTVKARFCLRCLLHLLHASEQRVKSELEHKRMMSSELQSDAFWWENINVVAESSVIECLDILREPLELSDDDEEDGSSATIFSSFSISDSGLREEFGVASTKNDGLLCVAEHAS